MGKKSNKQLRKANGLNQNLDDITRLRELYVVKEDGRFENRGKTKWKNKP